MGKHAFWMVSFQCLAKSLLFSLACKNLGFYTQIFTVLYLSKKAKPEEQIKVLDNLLHLSKLIHKNNTWVIVKHDDSDS